jgi:hypothetical protein
MPRTYRAALLTLLFSGTLTAPVLAQGASTWFLAEGANNAIFSQEILVGNPSADTLTVTVTLLPQPDAITSETMRSFTLGPTSRLTVRLGDDFGLNGSSSARVNAVIANTATPADIVVERTMYFPGAMRTGAHNAGGVTEAAAAWTLAEGATLAGFDTFVLVANPNATAVDVRATYLTDTGQEFVTVQSAPANSRVTFWPRQEHPQLEVAAFSTFVQSLTVGNGVIAERAMYFDGLGAGHDALGVAAPSTTWYFAEGFTGGNPTIAFETFLLLANTGNVDTTATVDYLLDSGEVVSINYPVAARSRFTVWVDQEGRLVDNRLANAAFGIRVTSLDPIVAERAVYWGAPSSVDPTTPASPWRDGHATAGTPAPAQKWAFAEGQQGVFGAASTRYDSFFLVANPNPVPIAVRATFVREDGFGIVREACVGGNARGNIWAADYPELSGHRFATFLETVASATCASTGNETFVAERATYLGAGFQAGHANMGTPWTGTIATPPAAPAFAITSIAPNAGRLGGNQPFTISGAGFQQGARVVFVNPEWTTDRNANTILPNVDEAFDVVVSMDGTTITGRTPRRSFATGYQTAGPATVRVINPDTTSIEQANGFTFRLNVLAFGDDFVYGQLDNDIRATTPFPARLQQLLTSFNRPLLDPNNGLPTGDTRVQFGTHVTVTNGGVVGECVSSTVAPCTGQSGSQRYPTFVDAVASANAADAFDAVVFLHGINDVRFGHSPVSVRNALRGMLTQSNTRGIVPIVTRLDDGTNLLSQSDRNALNAEIWALTEELLGFEIYRQALFEVDSGGQFPLQNGYDRMGLLVFEKVAREFPLQPCDVRADKAGIGCPRNP